MMQNCREDCTAKFRRLTRLPPYAGKANTIRGRRRRLTSRDEFVFAGESFHEASGDKQGRMVSPLSTVGKASGLDIFAQFVGQRNVQSQEISGYFNFFVTSATVFGR